MGNLQPNLEQCYFLEKASALLCNKGGKCGLSRDFHKKALNNRVFKADVLTKFSILTTLFKHINNFAGRTFAQRANLCMKQ